MFKKKKLSIDFLNSCYQSLTQTAQEEKVSNSDIVNTLITVFLQLSSDVRQDLSNYCQNRYAIEKANASADTFSALERENKAALAQEYLKIGNFLKIDQEEDVHPKMRMVFLKEGYTIFPEDWIILEDICGRPEDCMYAGVVESRNCEKYHIPHFVFFSDYKYGRDYPEKLEKKVYAACASAYPDFKRLFNLQRPIPDHTGTDPEGKKLLKEWYDAPQFALFHLPEKGDPMYWNRITPNYDPPYGAMIIRIN